MGNCCYSTTVDNEEVERNDFVLLSDDWFDIENMSISSLSSVNSISGSVDMVEYVVSPTISPVISQVTTPKSLP